MIDIEFSLKKKKLETSVLSVNQSEIYKSLLTATFTNVFKPGLKMRLAKPKFGFDQIIILAWKKISPTKLFRLDLVKRVFSCESQFSIANIVCLFVKFCVLWKRTIYVISSRRCIKLDKKTIDSWKKGLRIWDKYNFKKIHRFLLLLKNF